MTVLLIHIAAITQLRLETDGRTYYRRKRANGKNGSLRCLTRRIKSLEPEHQPDLKAPVDNGGNDVTQGRRGGSCQLSGHARRTERVRVIAGV